jgi:hypothetical protein
MYAGCDEARLWSFAFNVLVISGEGTGAVCSLLKGPTRTGRFVISVQWGKACGTFVIIGVQG